MSSLPVSVGVGKTVAVLNSALSKLGKVNESKPYQYLYTLKTIIPFIDINRFAEITLLSAKELERLLFSWYFELVHTEHKTRPMILLHQSETPLYKENLHSLLLDVQAGGRLDTHIYGSML